MGGKFTLHATAVAAATMATFVSYQVFAEMRVTNEAQAQPSLKDSMKAHHLAGDAIQRLEAHPFESAYLRSALQDIQTAAALDQNEPLVYAALSTFVRITSFRSGDWYVPESHEPGAAGKIRELADQAVSMARKDPEAYYALARAMLIQGEISQAAAQLNVAKELQGDPYEYLFLNGVVEQKKGDLTKAAEYYDSAAKQAQSPTDQARAYEYATTVYMSSKDYTSVESTYKKAIAASPTPQRYGNYGQFLYQMHRCKEAVEILQKGLAIASYPIGEEYLKKSEICALTQSHQGR